MIRTLLATAAITATLAVAPPAQADGQLRWFMVPCEYEDSISCIWDAKHMGNGEGKSFRVGYNGRIKYISHRKAARLLGHDAHSALRH
jgi:hypothetical protein